MDIVPGRVRQQYRQETMSDWLSFPSFRCETDGWSIRSQHAIHVSAEIAGKNRTHILVVVGGAIWHLLLATICEISVLHDEYSKSRCYARSRIDEQRCGENMMGLFLTCSSSHFPLPEVQIILRPPISHVMKDFSHV